MPASRPLRRSLFISGCAIDLSGKKQSLDRLGLKRTFQRARIEIVVFDRIAGPGDVRVFQPLDGSHQLNLHVERQAGGDSVRIHLVGIEALRLQENLVRFLCRKAHHLIFDGRAITRADAFDHTGEQRRAIQAAADDVVSAAVGVR